MKACEEYLRMVSAMYERNGPRKHLPQLLLEHGHEMTTSPLTYEEARYIVRVARAARPIFRTAKNKRERTRNRKLGLGAFVPQQCYQNAQVLVINDFQDRLTYCEGYVGGVIPLPHAWVTINGKVVDLTIRAAQRARGKPLVNDDYFGVTSSREIMMSILLRTCVHNPLTEMGEFWVRAYGEGTHESQRCAG